MQIGLYWSLLAGFLLGFSVSTLWEWFYFRQRRMVVRDQRIRELEAKLLDQESQADGQHGEGAFRDTWQDIDYRSPGVFLEAEADTAVDNDFGVVEADPIRDASANRTRRSDYDPIARTATGVRAAPFRMQSMSAERTTEKAGAAELDAFTDVGTTTEVAQASSRSPATTSHRSDQLRVARPAEDYPDDLSKIKGIGEVYKHRLYAAGICTWHQIAQSSQSVLRAATKAYPSSNVDEWPPQAAELAARHGREGAKYSGPTPNDLTKITGIGPVGTQILYRAGICTYEELAATPTSTLSELFPIAVAGDEPDFEYWIVQARQLQMSGSER